MIISHLSLIVKLVEDEVRPMEDKNKDDLIQKKTEALCTVPTLPNFLLPNVFDLNVTALGSDYFGRGLPNGLRQSCCRSAG